jgi:hypothetical protein
MAASEAIGADNTAARIAAIESLHANFGLLKRL